ncbi:hypothetical protein P3T43_001989 [Paraburkholderia sp. GAS41]
MSGYGRFCARLSRSVAFGTGREPINRALVGLNLCLTSVSDRQQGNFLRLLLQAMLK